MSLKVFTCVKGVVSVTLREWPLVALSKLENGCGLAVKGGERGDVQSCEIMKREMW